jgi:hypothetical protein
MPLAVIRHYNKAVMPLGPARCCRGIDFAECQLAEKGTVPFFGRDRARGEQLAKSASDVLERREQMAKFARKVSTAGKKGLSSFWQIAITSRHWLI